MTALIILSLVLLAGFILAVALAWKDAGGRFNLWVFTAVLLAIVLIALWIWPGWVRLAVFPPAPPKAETTTLAVGCVDKTSQTPDGVHPAYQAGQTVTVGTQSYLCVGNPTTGEFTWVVATEAAPLPATAIPTIVPTLAAPTLPNFTQQWEVPAGLWTPAVTENLVIELAIQVRPDRPWEGNVGPVEGQVYQFKTEYLDEDATTWQPGVHLYEYDLAAGWQPVFVGIQGDSPVQLCWMQEKGAQGAQLLMKTMQGNGTSALVFFTKTDKVPTAICP